MPNSQSEVVNLSVQPDAHYLAAERVREYGTSLLLEAKLCAVIDDSGLVLRKHIVEATEKLKTKQRSSPARELRLAFGGALFGAFIQGFITELAAKNQTLVAVYTLLGLLGMFLVLWDLRK